MILLIQVKKRVAVFDLCQEKCYGNKQRKRRFQRVDTTRWWSHDYALNTVLDTFDALCNTLVELQKSESSSDRKGAYQAKNLRENIMCDRFLLTAIVYKQLFLILTPLSKMLQAVDIDLIGVITVIDDKIHSLETTRSDDNFFKLLEELEQFKISSTLGYEEFKPLPQNRLKRVPRKDGEISHDTTIIDPLHNFKVKTFLVACDTAIIQTKERFSEISKGVYKDLSLFCR